MFAFAANGKTLDPSFAEAGILTIKGESFQAPVVRVDRSDRLVITAGGSGAEELLMRSSTWRSGTMLSVVISRIVGTRRLRAA